MSIAIQAVIHLQAGALAIVVLQDLVMTADLLLVQIIRVAIMPPNLTAIAHYLGKQHIALRGRSKGMATYLLKVYFYRLQGLKWTIDSAFPFDPKTITKIKNRKFRKACYKCFAHYKKPNTDLNTSVWGELNSFIREYIRDGDRGYFESNYGSNLDSFL